MKDDTIFSDIALISSGPGAPFLSDFNIPTISSVVTWVKNILFTNAGPMKWRWDTFWPGIFLARLGPIFVKNSLNLLPISVPSEIIVPSLNLNLSCIYLVLFLFTIFFIICHDFFLSSLWEECCITEIYDGDQRDRCRILGILWIW